MSIQNVSLFYKDARSDKEYHVQIEQVDAGYVVNFQYGRRGSSLQSGTKTAKPVTMGKAISVYEALVREKVGKGYAPGASSHRGVVNRPAASHSSAQSLAEAKAQRATGVIPQLLNPISQDDVERYIEDAAWVMQQKFDGRRMLVKVGSTNEITGINRKGESVGISKAIAEELFSLGKKHFVLDGEAIGEKLYVFDVLEYRGGDVRDLPFKDRYRYLTELLSALPANSSVELAPMYASAADKRAAFEALRASGAEGAVFKQSDSRYVPGRPASGGSALKVKFWQTASVLVESINDKRSVAIALLDGNGAMVNAGNVTIPPNQQIPNPGSILEVRYLYAFEGGSLFQPTSLGARDDIEREDCVMSQLIYKSEGELVAEAAPSL